MNKYLLLHFGFEKPSPAITAKRKESTRVYEVRSHR